MEFLDVVAEELLRHAGVRCSQEKSMLLVHRSAVLPDNIPVNLPVTRDGLVMVGAAIGEDDFVSAHILKVVKNATLKLGPLRH